MSSERDEVARQFAHDLARLHQMAGRPSYADLERASRHLPHQLRRATVSDILNGKRVNVPDWRFVSAFVTACRSVAEASGLDAPGLGTIAEWKQHWDSAKEGVIDTCFPGRGHPKPASAQPLEAAAEGSPPPEPSSSVIKPADISAVGGGATVLPSEPIWGPVPHGIGYFVGRESLLDHLNHFFVQDARLGALTIQGLGGIGKTQLAIEYAQRNASHYDLVWWIACDTRASARRGMEGLEARLGLTRRPAPPREYRFAAVFDALRLGRPYKRWLLVFDNANEPDEIRDLIPPRQGHILITSRNSHWEASEEVVELDVLARQESVKFLRHRIRGLSEAEAQQLADAIGDFPLVLEHAADSRMTASEYLFQLEHSPSALFSEYQPPGYPVQVADAWRLPIDRLVRETSTAMDLLRCLAFFGSGPIPLDVLKKGEQLPGISLYALLSEPIERSRAIRALGRAGLVRVSASSKRLQVHRLTQSFVRDLLTTKQASRLRHDAHQLLAATDPRDPDNPDNWPQYAELRGHMTRSDVLGCQDFAVRRLVINVVSYLHVAGNPTAAVSLADQALSRWTAEAGTKDSDVAAARLAMQRRKAEALFSLGSYQASLELSRSTLDEMRSDPGRWREDILILRRATGTGFRISGDFVAALEADTTITEQHISGFDHDQQRISGFDRDHPETFIALNNLAVDNALNGNYERAVQVSYEAYHGRHAFYGRADHLSVLAYQNSLARFQRLAGHYHEALRLTEEVRNSYDSLITEGILNEDHPWLLRHRIDYAAARRDAGLGEAELDALASHIHDVHQLCWGAFRMEHPTTLAAAVALGSLLRRISGRTDEAATIVAAAERLYGSTLGAEHPYTFACTMVLAGIRRQAGAPAEAVALLDGAVAGLESAIGKTHPFTLNAVAVLVNALADIGDVQTAVTRGEEALEDSRHVVGPDHPDTLGCAANLTAAMSVLGRDHEAATLRQETLERYARTLGENHPDVQRFVTGGRSDPDFTPLPL